MATLAKSRETEVKHPSPFKARFAERLQSTPNQAKRRPIIKSVLKCDIVAYEDTIGSHRCLINAETKQGFYKQSLKKSIISNLTSVDNMLKFFLCSFDKYGKQRLTGEVEISLISMRLESSFSASLDGSSVPLFLASYFALQTLNTNHKDISNQSQSHRQVQEWLDKSAADIDDDDFVNPDDDDAIFPIESTPLQSRTADQSTGIGTGKRISTTDSDFRSPSPILNPPKRRKIHFRDNKNKTSKTVSPKNVPGKGENNGITARRLVDTYFVGRGEVNVSQISAAEEVGQFRKRDPDTVRKLANDMVNGNYISMTSGPMALMIDPSNPNAANWSPQTSSAFQMRGLAGNHRFSAIALANTEKADCVDSVVTADIFSPMPPLEMRHLASMYQYNAEKMKHHTTIDRFLNYREEKINNEFVKWNFDQKTGKWETLNKIDFANSVFLIEKSDQQNFAPYVRRPPKVIEMLVKVFDLYSNGEIFGQTAIKKRAPKPEFKFHWLAPIKGQSDKVLFEQLERLASGDISLKVWIKEVKLIGLELQIQSRVLECVGIEIKVGTWTEFEEHFPIHAAECNELLLLETQSERDTAITTLINKIKVESASGMGRPETTTSAENDGSNDDSEIVTRHIDQLKDVHSNKPVLLIFDGTNHDLVMKSYLDQAVHFSLVNPSKQVLSAVILPGDDIYDLGKKVDEMKVALKDKASVQKPIFLVKPATSDCLLSETTAGCIVLVFMRKLRNLLPGLNKVSQFQKITKNGTYSPQLLSLLNSAKTCSVSISDDCYFQLSTGVKFHYSLSLSNNSNAGSQSVIDPAVTTNNLQ